MGVSYGRHSIVLHLYRVRLGRMSTPFQVIVDRVRLERQLTLYRFIGFRLERLSTLNHNRTKFFLGVFSDVLQVGTVCGVPKKILVGYRVPWPRCPPAGCGSLHNSPPGLLHTGETFHALAQTHRSEAVILLTVG